MLLDIDSSARQIVTSSDLVRHFGHWQDKAAREPVYVLHRGRLRFVITAVDIMDALCATSADQGALAEAMAAAGGIAAARIDRDGFIESPDPVLADFLRQPLHLLHALPFADLFDTGSRKAVAHAVAAVAAGAQPQSVDARSWDDPEAPADIRIGLARRRGGAAESGVVAVMTTSLFAPPSG
ncbi:hypothetical protein [Sphingomonas immobilis]|uniref:Uncharacterized protein n=1 Tax=Sphingomonas immobilis TaxID=3063997 RepID=A0ABT8ZVZ1_9SPHN|nr:hypothetical protein [Sphingomonas sp. CA1-15]MDO7841175.1 hypothetical protein [Sphingomonas sp. CA1-15]